MQPPIDRLLPPLYDDLQQTAQDANVKLGAVLSTTGQQLHDELNQPRKKYRRSKSLGPEPTEADASQLPLDVQSSHPALFAALASAST